MNSSHLYSIFQASPLVHLSPPPSQKQIKDTTDNSPLSLLKQLHTTDNSPIIINQNNMFIKVPPKINSPINFSPSSP